MTKTRTNRESTRNVTPSHSAPPARHIRRIECDASDLARAARIKELIEDDSNVVFASDCGFSEGMLRKYLKGSTPGSDKLAAMARHRGVRMEWLTNGEPPKYKRDVANQGQTSNGALIAHQYMHAPTADYKDGVANSALLRLCLLACYQVHGEDFQKALVTVQIEYACDLYNHLVMMANTKGPSASLEDFCKLDARSLAEQLRFFLQMRWVKPFPAVS